MVKLYHVIHTRYTRRKRVDVVTILSSWETEQEAIDAIRHWFITKTDTPERGTSHFKEKNGKDGYEAKIEYKPVLSVRYSEEEGAKPVSSQGSCSPQADSTLEIALAECSVPIPLTAHPTKLAQPFPPFLWGVYSITDKEQEYMHTLYDSLPYANQQARKLAWEECYEYCADFETGCAFLHRLRKANKGQGYQGNWAKRHYGDHIPRETNKGSEDRCFRVDVPMVDSSMLGASFELYVRPVVLNKTPSQFKAESGAKVEETMKETGGKRKRQPVEDEGRPGIKASAKIKPNVGKKRIGRLFRQPGDTNESDSSRPPTEDEDEDMGDGGEGDDDDDEAESDGLSSPVFATKWPKGYDHGGLF